MREACALTSQAIDMRSFYDRVTINTGVTIAKVVNVDDKNVWQLRICRGPAKCRRA
ncbi:MAG: hypothetical protein Cons2KO_05840 [Congregibacter sp.]